MSKQSTTLVQSDLHSYRLPRGVVPSKYELSLEPDLKNFTFAGSETIHVSVLEPVRDVLMNALELEISQASAEHKSGKSLIAKVELIEKDERVKLSFTEDLQAGEWLLKLQFKGTLNDKLRGFYRSVYKDSQGESQTLACTQFESTDARRAFPCFDEPDFKAVFKTTLTVDEKLTAISNAGIEKVEKLVSGKKAVHFKETVKMSTYLVAFVVGEFAGTDVRDVDGTPIRIWAPPNQIHLAKFAEGIAAHSLTFFNKYYGIKYVGDKLEFIAIPDFAYGGMENLGCITFRETALLVDEKTASHAELERVADVVAHEVAHMWFGDLATMRWWNGLWLNEAFANFMEMIAVDSWKPEWKRWETFGVARAVALATDGLASTRKIECPVNHPKEAEAMFDVLTYDKGGAVLRMLEQYLEPENFRKGIALYLQKHKFANTETTDLWDAIEEATKQPVRQVMDSWIFQEGHPVIEVELADGGKSLELKQKRFFYNTEAGKNNQTLFAVPIILRAKTGQGVVKKRILLKESSTKVTFDSPVEWAIVNDGGHGFYRVNYAQNLLDSLVALLPNKITAGSSKEEENMAGLKAIERFNLVGDCWALVLAGQMSLSQFLKMAIKFKYELDKNVWTILISALNYIDKTIEPNNRKYLEQFASVLLEPAFEHLGWEEAAGEADLTAQLRGTLIDALGSIGNSESVQKKAFELYQKFKQDQSEVSPDVSSALISLLSSTGDEKIYEEFSQAYKNASNPQEIDRYVYALANFRHKALLNKTLEKTLNGEVRTQTAPYLIARVLLNPQSKPEAWEFLKTNWNICYERFPSSSITRMCAGITSLVDEKLAADAHKFFSENEQLRGNKIIAQHLEKLDIAISLKKREGQTLSKSFLA